ncbi:glycoside hydrolase family 2 TIM barrel-domain containing protein [Limibacter armeniacum]|uniref:glycoside hydrolase family 2 protein n=1 Tax=Limibacter armeniacum TaxID=466084 RepID=UPI002FE69F9C
MKKIFSLIFTVLLAYHLQAQLPAGYPKTNRVKENINLDWKFSKMLKGEKPSEENFDDRAWEKVNLPHNPDPLALDLDSVTEHWRQETFLRDQNWYRKKMRIDLTENEKAFIEFEGVHNATELYVNGNFVGRFAVNGYVSHHFDITDFVKSGEVNTIVVNADNSYDPMIAPDPDETDYVKWAGIYRDVYLVKTNRLHVNFNWEDAFAGVHITTPTVKKRNGTVSVRTTVVNEYSEASDCRIETMIVDADGAVVKKMTARSNVGQGQHKVFRQTTDIVDNYHLWSPDHPYLYRAVSVVYLNDKPVDFIENTFGFRSIELVDGQGLLLNGEPFFMIGINRHQNYPHIGDAVPNSMHFEAALAYKKAGVNAIRLSHYPQDNAFIEACDKLGIVLYEEPSTWILWDQGEWMDKLEQSMRMMVRNHRNHPSIIIWGAGINHRGPVPQLNSAAKEEDPFRLTASASSPWCGVKNAGGADIYATMDYRRTDWPEGDFCLVMEHGESNDGLAQQFHISRYKKRKNNIGALLWVGADYNRLRPNPKEHDMYTEYGMQTIYRVPRPAYYWYQSENSKVPFVHIADESVYKNEKIHVYSNAPKVALYANDKLVAIQSADNDPLRIMNKFPSFTFRYQWTNEKLTAKALYEYENIPLATHTRTKAGEPYALKLAVDNPSLQLTAGGSDLKMIRAYVVDKNGEVVINADNKVHFETKGAGTVVYEKEAFVENMQVYHGVATVYLSGTAKAGEVEIKATSGKLKSATIELTTVPFIADELAKNAQPIYDNPIYKIDIQTEGQLSQFGWEVANGGDSDAFTFQLGESTFSVTADEGLKWRKGTYTILGDLAFMGCDGVYTDAGDLKLTITGLSKGKYELKTYHHSFENRNKLFPYNMAVTRRDARDVFSYISDDEPVGIFNAKDIGERKPISVTNIIESNGTDPVEIYFRTDKESAATWLNGLEFKRVHNSIVEKRGI